MKKLVTLLIGCSFVSAVGVQAEQKNVKKKPVQGQPKMTPVQQQGGMKPHLQVPHSGQAVPAYHAPKAKGANIPKHQVHTPSNVYPHKGSAVPNQIQSREKMKGHANAPAFHKMPNAPTNQLPAVQSNAFHGVKAPSRVPEVNAAELPAVQSTRKAAAQNIRAQHANFRAHPSTNVASAQYNQNYRIVGAENWRGAHYEVFRSYHPVWHDRTWWNSNYNHVVLIGGGWYFWNAGYWYPAWGYDPAYAYYPYDGPIYVGATPRPADQVVADVQSILQQEGYYQGAVDGLLGPLTRDALASYQSAQGLEPTAAIDQPTLESLGLG